MNKYFNIIEQNNKKYFDKIENLISDSLKDSCNMQELITALNNNLIQDRFNYVSKTMLSYFPEGICHEDSELKTKTEFMFSIDFWEKWVTLKNICVQTQLGVISLSQESSDMFCTVKGFSSSYDNGAYSLLSFKHELLKIMREEDIETPVLDKNKKEHDTFFPIIKAYENLFIIAETHPEAVADYVFLKKDLTPELIDILLLEKDIKFENEENKKYTFNIKDFFIEKQASNPTNKLK